MSKSAVDTLTAGLQGTLEEYSFAPFWFWNDQLEKPELERQLTEMKAKGVDQVVIHARLGLRTAYLSEEWFDCVAHCLRCARDLRMKVWIYDEKNWPSGCAGGMVLERNPAGRARHIVMHRMSGQQILSNPMEIVPEGDLVAALLVSPAGDQVLDVTDQVHYHLVEFDPPAPDWNAYFFLERPDARCHPLALPYQTNCLDPAVVAQFIELTHEEYYRRFAADFGGTILGFFTDEPGLYYNLFQMQPGSIPWSAGLLEDFKQQHGYDLAPRLPWLWEAGPLAAQTRADYWATVSRRFTDAYFVQLRQWCDAHGVQLIGHLEWEEFLSTQVQFLGDFFTPMRQMHMAGVDRIDLNFEKVAEKLASSVQHTTPGLTRTMSESFALSGWDLTLHLARRIVDWQYARGVNFIVPHAFHYSIRDARRNECPPSLFIQNTFWPHFRVLADYTKRLGYLLCQGELETPIALYHPMNAARRRFDPNKMPMPDICMITDPKDSSTTQLDHLLLELTQAIEREQSDFDFVDDDALRTAGYTSEGIAIAAQRYRALIVPDWAEAPAETRERLSAWARQGGLLLTFNSQDSGLEPVPAQGPRHRHGANAAEMADVIAAHGLRVVELNRPAPAIRVMGRRVENERLVFFNNESPQRHQFEVVLAAGEHPCRIDCTSGAICQLPVRQREGQTSVTLALDGYSSTVLLFAREGWDALAMETPCPSDEKLAFAAEWTLELAGQTHCGALQPWSAYGAAEFSGQAVYHNTFVVPPEHEGAEIWLDLGEVCELAEIVIDGQPVALACWPPWQMRLPGLAVGAHELRIVVSNTPINAFEKVARRSGLLGPVRLLAGVGAQRSHAGRKEAAGTPAGS